ncbi:MAG: alpha-2-macroglobulin, partial [Candidatus Eremiobacteraeota bacterium]|nr:alpha-2-macroglobulin [Candidatus Eremiobacteraeota bacterium]
TPTLVYTYYSPWDNTFSFSFDSKPSTDYEVRLSPGIEDPYGNTTRENLTVRFRTAPLDPYYQLRTSDLVGTYDAALPATLFVGYVNINTLNLNLYRLDPQLIFRPTWEWNDYQPNSSDLIRQWTERLEAPADEQSFQPIDLVEGGGRLEPGLYYLSTESPQVSDRYFGGNRHVLVVTETNLTLKAGQKDALVWATDLATGRPMAGQEVTFFDDNNRQLGTAITDQDGLARLDVSQRPYRSTMLAAILPQGEPQGEQGFSAVSENWAQGISPWEFGLEVAYELPIYNVHLYTDRPIYRPGQDIYFKGIIRTEDDVTFQRPDLRQVHVTLRDAAYETVLDEMVELTPAGTFNGEVTLEAGAALGT